MGHPFAQVAVTHRLARSQFFTQLNLSIAAYEEADSNCAGLPAW